MKDIETPDMREWASVRAVRNILALLKRDKEIYDWKEMPKYSPGDDKTPENWADRNGRDFIIQFKRKNNSVFDVPLQVKSSMRRVQEHYAWTDPVTGAPQTIDAITNEDGYDLAYQILQIIDKHKEADWYLRNAERGYKISKKLKMAWARKRAAGLIPEKPKKVGDQQAYNKRQKEAAHQKIQAYLDKCPSPYSVNAIAEATKSSRSTVSKYLKEIGRFPIHQPKK